MTLTRMYLFNYLLAKSFELKYLYLLRILIMLISKHRLDTLNV